jgi:hypothetical protein
LYSGLTYDELDVWLKETPKAKGSKENLLFINERSAIAKSGIY